MSRNGKRVPACLFLAIAAIGLGLYRLGEVPDDLSRAELDIASEARAVAATGRSTTGERLPLFFVTKDYPPGREPLNIYAAAGLLLAFPFSASMLRVPSVLLGAANVVLIYLVARRFFRRESVAIVAAILLLTSPAHLIYSRTAINVLYPVLFVLLWLWFLAMFFGETRPRFAFLAGLALGLGIYSHPTAVLTMPILFAATVAVILAESRRWDATASLALAGFAIPLTAWFVWAWQHFDRLSALASHYMLYDAATLNIVQGISDMTSYFGLSVRAYIYWQYFSPSLLFFGNETGVMDSAHQVGLLVFPAALLLGVGLHRIVSTRQGMEPLLVAGFLCAPVAAALEPSLAVRRILVILPFAALIAAAGFDALVSSPRWRFAAVTALVLSLVQFGWFGFSYLWGRTFELLASSQWFAA